MKMDQFVTCLIPPTVHSHYGIELDMRSWLTEFMNIWGSIGVDRGMFKLNLFLRQPCGRTCYNVSTVMDDEILEIMYDVWNEIVPFIIEIYIEKEEIDQNILIFNRKNFVGFCPSGHSDSIIQHFIFSGHI